MITAEQLLSRLEAMYEANGLLIHGLNNAASAVSEAQTRLTDAEEDLKSTRAAAIASKQIQVNPDHGTNQALRDAHERDMLKAHYNAVTVAQLNLQIARANLDQVSREEAGLRRALRICEMQTRLLGLTLSDEDTEDEQEG